MAGRIKWLIAAKSAQNNTDEANQLKNAETNQLKSVLKKDNIQVYFIK